MDKLYITYVKASLCLPGQWNAGAGDAKNKGERPYFVYGEVYQAEHKIRQSCIKEGDNEDNCCERKQGGN